jgi:allantoicase
MSSAPVGGAGEAGGFEQLVDLAAEAHGGQALLASDEFFAGKENLLKAGRGVFMEGRYTEQGKWMDGWESRRKRTPGHDWCLLRLGMPGQVYGVDIDTNHFTGNFPEHASLEGCAAAASAGTGELLGPGTRWTTLLPISRLQGGSRNLFAVAERTPVTHLRLNIFPDGGVARLRVHGVVSPDWERARGGDGLVDLAALANGGVVAAVNDQFFGHAHQLIAPGLPANMGEGWETRRKRGPGNDWLVLRLGAPGTVRRAEVFTTWFKGNYPDRCSLEGIALPADAPDDLLASRSLAWQELLPPSKLGPDARHLFEAELRARGPFTHVRLSIYPDGGVARLRLFGERSGG